MTKHHVIHLVMKAIKLFSNLKYMDTPILKSQLCDRFRSHVHQSYRSYRFSYKVVYHTYTSWDTERMPSRGGYKEEPTLPRLFEGAMGCF